MNNIDLLNLNDDEKRNLYIYAVYLINECRFDGEKFEYKDDIKVSIKFYIEVMDHCIVDNGSIYDNYRGKSTATRFFRTIEYLENNKNNILIDDSDIENNSYFRTLIEIGVIQKKGDSSYSYDDEKLKKYFFEAQKMERVYRLFKEVYDDLMANKKINMETTLTKLNEKIELIEENSRVEDEEIDESDNIESKKIIEYLKNAVKLESDIISLKKRLSDLYNKKSHYKEYIKSDLFKGCYAFLTEEETKNKSNGELSIIKVPELEDFLRKIPKEPTLDFEKPEEPQLMKAGLFNKKKVELENQKRIDEYNQQLSEYEKMNSEFLIKQEDYKNNYKQYEKEAEQEYNKALDRYNNITKKILPERLLQVPSIVKIEQIEYEIEFIFNTLQNTIKVLNELYSKNLIFGKYRDIVALSSFLDYYMSGRCDSLKGTNGAYNLYEQESRTDIIINKMDLIVDKLEDISRIDIFYKELKNINRTLDKINDNLLVNNMLQAVQVGELAKIISNTNEIAYNTEVTAFYAEKAAHYSEALTYLKLLS